MILRGQNFTSKTDFLRWMDENTSLGECAVCKAAILQIPFGRRRVVCGPACAKAYREEEKMRGGQVCVTCGRKMTAPQRQFAARRLKRYANIPPWLREIEEEQAAEAKKKADSAV